MLYTPPQQQAIDCIDHNLQIIACAGSGKTDVVARRIAELLTQPDVAPRNVVAFTFTEKAAAELKDRVLRRIEDAGGSTIGLAEMFVGTMHAYCLDLLQRYVPETFRYRVLTDVTNRLLIDRHSRESGLTTCPTSSKGTPHLRRYLHSGLYQTVLAVLREDDIVTERVPDGVWASFISYIQLLAKHSYFDYTAMVRLAVELLEDEDAASDLMQAHVHGDLRYLVVDEYQDVNPLQERLIRALTKHGANLCVVGDDDQTIYQWRGSEVRNILSFSDRYPDVQQVTLADNFRSSRGIVSLGRTIAESIPAGQRLVKDMVASGHQQWQRGDIVALEFPSPEAEAAWICDRIQELRGLPFTDGPGATPRGLSWSDVAVLYRSVAADADALVDEMRRRGMPYVVKGLNRLFDSPEIQAVVQVFAYLVGEIGADELRTAWEDALLVEPGRDWTAAIRVLETARSIRPGSRWGVYNIQRLYLDLLEALEVREDTIPDGESRAELVFYQLGKFSQVISDFEEIHFSSSPEQKYRAFRDWLRHQAPDYYADADSDVGYATPDAVVISTVHQAKGMQYPAVFVPCLRRNRFPSKRHGGLRLFHVVPPEAVPEPDRYLGTVEDETRLFYVAVTRAQKYLALTFSPAGSKMYNHRSQFFDLAVTNPHVSTKATPLSPAAGRLTPSPRHEVPQVSLSFSELKYLFECPYQFKLRFLYGFNPPIHEALGYGKGLHDALAEVHKRAIEGEVLTVADAEQLVDRHLHTPYAYPALREQLQRSAVEAIRRYFQTNGDQLTRTEHSEKQIQVHLGEGVVVEGRIDLIRRLDTHELSIVDFKSTERAQPEDVTRDQLHVYALGYQELSGEQADLIEVLNLDEAGRSTREQVETPLLDAVRQRIVDAGESLRTGNLPRYDTWCNHCDTCDLVALCRARQHAGSG
ncbi:MAG: ATP-dependent helicase [Actinobacteria bacterium]|nr:ATP-dependent helicase [Actinomycetota bacterium]